MVGIVNFEIDGRNVKAKTGTTIMEAALNVGIEIPHMCYHEDTEHQSGCRICSVEVEKNWSRRIVAACSYPVEEGIKVTTVSPKIAKIRKTILELAAVSSGPNVASKMQALAKEYGADLTRFSSRVEHEETKCILCGLCVNRCLEATYNGVIGFVGRGVDRRIVRFPEISEACPTCNYCYSVCPTGRITSVGPSPSFPSFNDVLSGRK